MHEIETREYAQRLLEMHGDKAIIVAATKARSFEAKGNTVEAKAWRHIEEALKLMRGPHQG